MPTGTYRIPSQVLTGNSVVCSAVFDATFANLAVGGTYTTIVFPSAFAPFFDVWIFADQPLSIQRQAAFSVTGPPGNVFRDTAAPLISVANSVLEQVAIRTANLFQRWIITNIGAAPTTILEAIILNRSI
jgi:hypothetical protein